MSEILAVDFWPLKWFQNFRHDLLTGSFIPYEPCFNEAAKLSKPVHTANSGLGWEAFRGALDLSSAGGDNELLPHAHNSGVR